MILQEIDSTPASLVAEKKLQQAKRRRDSQPVIQAALVLLDRAGLLREFTDYAVVWHPDNTLARIEYSGWDNGGDHGIG